MGYVIMTMTKHLRLTIDFTITIADVPPLLPEGAIEPADSDYNARQARLLEAVKGHTETLTRCLHDLVALKMAVHGWYGLMPDTSLEKILAPVLATLSAEDQAFFQEGVKYEVFEECIDMFSESFVITEDTPIIMEVEV